MKTNLLCAGVCATIAVFGAVKPASAVVFSIGSSAGGTFLSDFGAPGAPLASPGQSFTPNIPGNSGSGIAPDSGSVFLNSFTLGDQNSGTAYVFGESFTGTPADLSNQTLGVDGFLGSSTSVSDGTYSFDDRGIELSDVSAEYFVYIDTGVDFEFAQGNPYTGGIGLASGNPITGDDTFVPGTVAGFDDPDLVFSATFIGAKSVPEPSTILGLAFVLGCGNLLKKKRVS